MTPGHNHDHSHDHQGHGDGTADDQRRVRIAFFLIAGFMGVEVVGGVIANSLALLADAGHMLTDAGALALAWAGFRFAAQPSDEKRSYGYARAQVLAAFVNGLALVGLTLWIVIAAIGRIATPEEVHAVPLLVVATIGLGVNIVAYLVLHQGDRHNLNMRGAMLHVIGDMLGSVAAIAAAIIIMTTGWMAADPMLSLVVAGLIGWGAVDLLRRSSHILLEGTPDTADTAEIRARLLAEVDEVNDIHHMHVWLLTEKRPLVTFHARLNLGADADRALRQIKEVMAREFKLTHVTVQLEYGPCPDP